MTLTRPLPNAISIGAQRCASSFVTRLMKQHPQVYWLGEVNSLTRTLSQDGLEAIHDRYAEGAQAVIRGEKSPGYSILRPFEVKQIHRLLPDLKVIYTIRNPVDRCISALTRSWTYEYLPGNPIVGRSERDMVRAVDAGLSVRLTNYPETMANWSAYFPRHQQFISTFDEIHRDPRQWSDRLCRFLGVDASQLSKDVTTAKVNVSKVDVEADHFVRFYLAMRWRPMLDRLTAMMPETEDISVWKDNLDMLIRRGRERTGWLAKYFRYRGAAEAYRVVMYTPGSYAKAILRASKMAAAIRSGSIPQPRTRLCRRRPF